MHGYFESLVAATITFLGGAWIFRMVGLLIVSRIDFDTYVRLCGRTNAMPDWQPWWGYWLLWAISTIAGAALASIVGWHWRAGARKIKDVDSDS